MNDGQLDEAPNEPTSESGCFQRGCVGPLLGAISLTVVFDAWLIMNTDPNAHSAMFDTTERAVAVYLAVGLMTVTIPVGALIGSIIQWIFFKRR